MKANKTDKRKRTLYAVAMSQNYDGDPENNSVYAVICKTKRQADKTVRDLFAEVIDGYYAGAEDEVEAGEIDAMIEQAAKDRIWESGNLTAMVNVIPQKIAL